VSAYSEWKYGLITDAEYETICKREWYEERMRLWAEGHDWSDCEFEEDDIDDFD
jgi:hypothetical protein